MTEAKRHLLAMSAIGLVGAGQDILWTLRRRANCQLDNGKRSAYDAQISAAMEDIVMGSANAANRVKLLGLAMTLLPLLPVGFTGVADAKITNIVIAKRM